MERREVLLAITELKSSIDKRFDTLEQQLDKRLDSVDEQLYKIRQKLELDGEELQSVDIGETFGDIKKQLEVLRYDVEYVAKIVNEQSDKIIATDHFRRVVSGGFDSHTVQNSSLINIFHVCYSQLLS